MDGRITQIPLVVSDQAAAVAFFTDQVGWEKKSDYTSPGGYRWVTVGLAAQDVVIALILPGSATEPTQKEGSKRWTPGSAPPFVVQVPDCRKAYDELQARGVSFPQPPADHPWGTVATFSDPDGNLFSLSQPRSASAPRK